MFECLQLHEISWFWILSNLTDSIILLHDSVCLYVVHRVQDQLNAMQRRVSNIQTYCHVIFTSLDH
jgi:hypothetical protein